jgi:gluconate 2-dehydrogenase gamma chain
VEDWKLGREEGLNTTVSRRGFIFLLSALPLAPKTGLARAVSTSSEQNRPFDDADRRILGSLCEQIFPKDEFPGAIELGVPGFIERCLREAHSDWTGIYRAGFRSTEASSHSVHQKSFLELSSDQQTRLLERMQTGDLPKEMWPSVAAKDFFRMVRDHTLQGAYSHPKYGGNRNKAAWDMIGYYDFWVE